MSPKTKVTQKQILDAAFEIAEAEGLKQVSVRKVAAALGCSIAPIYVNFENSEALIKAIVEKAMAINAEYLTRPYTQEPFLNMGIGSIMLAYDHKRLYRDIVEQKGMAEHSDKAQHGAMISLMKTDPKLAGFSDAQMMRILFTMQVFTAGLCAFASAETMPEGITLEFLLQLLEDTGNDVINGTRKREKR